MRTIPYGWVELTTEVGTKICLNVATITAVLITAEDKVRVHTTGHTYFSVQQSLDEVLFAITKETSFPV